MPTRSLFALSTNCDHHALTYESPAKVEIPGRGLRVFFNERQACPGLTHPIPKGFPYPLVTFHTLNAANYLRFQKFPAKVTSVLGEGLEPLISGSNPGVLL